ncbi:DUF3616 domain-containing protein [Cystobacter fuscus]
MTFEGTCDASGAVELKGGLFLVGDDENNVLRVYDGNTGGPPVQTFDLSSALGLPAGKKQAPETDIEAATPLPPLSFWMTSHGRKSSGKPDANRFRFFATRTSEDGKDVRLEGKPYTRLLDELLAAPQLKPFGLVPASQKAPKEEGGLNIEGLTVMEDGKSFLIGFRNPRPQGKALAVTLLNPLELLQGKPARLGPALLLDLGARASAPCRGGGAATSSSEAPRPAAMARACSSGTGRRSGPRSSPAPTSLASTPRPSSRTRTRTRSSCSVTTEPT